MADTPSCLPSKWKGVVYTYYYSTGGIYPKSSLGLAIYRISSLALHTTHVQPMRQYIGPSRSKC